MVHPLRAVDLFFPSIVVLLSLVGLVLGADRFVLGATQVAQRLGVSPLIIGMVIVGLGTSAPELLVSCLAAVDGEPGIAIGNALGSNIANIGLVLGATALIAPVRIDDTIRRRELPFLALVTGLSCALWLDGELRFVDGLGLVAGFIWLLVRMVKQRKDGNACESVDALGSDDESTNHASPALLSSLLNLVGRTWLVVGFVQGGCLGGGPNWLEVLG